MRKYLFIFLIPLLCYCKNNHKEAVLDEEKTTLEEKEVIVKLDSAKDAIFDMELDGEMWHKNDSVYASFSSASGFHSFYILSHYSSVDYQDLAFTAVIGVDLKNQTIHDRLARLEEDTVLASVYYAFSKMSYKNGKFRIKNHLGLSLPTKPTAMIVFKKLDTVKMQVSGIFQGYVRDNSNQTYKFRKGIFLNVPYTFK